MAERQEGARRKVADGDIVHIDRVDLGMVIAPHDDERARRALQGADAWIARQHIGQEQAINLAAQIGARVAIVLLLIGDRDQPDQVIPVPSGDGARAAQKGGEKLGQRCARLDMRKSQPDEPAAPALQAPRGRIGVIVQVGDSRFHALAGGLAHACRPGKHL